MVTIWLSASQQANFDFCMLFLKEVLSTEHGKLDCGSFPISSALFGTSSILLQRPAARPNASKGAEEHEGGLRGRHWPYPAPTCSLAGNAATGAHRGRDPDCAVA
eukprot:COSAG01_NODE_171_length_23132_cov_53.865118_11_plen_105_part_00